jgi:integrase
MTRRGRGEGSIQLRDDGTFRAWLSRVKNGKRERESKVFPSKREALDWLRERRGRVSAPGTVEEWLRVWLRLIEPDKAPKTLAHDRWRVEKHLIPRLGPIKLRDLDAEDVQHMLADMAREGHSDSERQKAGAVLRKALRHAVRIGRLSVNPVAELRLPRPKRAEKRVATPDELRAFVQAAGDLGAIFQLWADTGLRPAEALGLRWEDVDLAAGTVTVNRALDPVTNQPKEPKTKRSRRTIPLSPATVAALRLVARPTGPVFVDSEGGYYWPSNFLKLVFTPIRKRARMPWMMPGTFRHSMATNLIRLGVPVRVVSERMGHEDISTTMRVYQHVIPHDQERAAAVMEAVWNPPEKRNSKGGKNADRHTKGTSAG